MNQVRILHKLLGALANNVLFAIDRIDQRFFAVHAADTRAFAPLYRPMLDVVGAINLMQRKHRALGRIAGIIAPHSGGIRLHGADFFFNHRWLFTQPNGVVVGLRHFFSVKSWHL